MTGSQHLNKIKKIKQKFLKIFPSPKDLIFIRAPGRINLIGEHTDYNGGFVLPIALNLEIIAAGSAREDGKVCLYSENRKTYSEFSLNENIEKDSNASWSNYPRGVIRILREKGFDLKGINIFYCGDIPPEGGLSSSAAIEVSTAFLLQEYLNLKIEPLEMIKLCQRAENEFVGVGCGIMDQFIVRLAKKERALFLNCAGLSYEQVPFSGKDVKVVVCNTMVKRNLKNSAYNERRRECSEAIGILGKFNQTNFEKYKSKLSPAVLKRTRHVISENERVKKAVAFLKESDFSSFGECLYGSHKSLRDDYDASCPELDLMVDLARGIKGVLGARMTGAGFGGCTVNIVKEGVVDKFKEKIFKEYKQKTGLSPEIYISTAENGVSRIE
jgi:galactokinase